jgi:hypothetical protein
MPARVHISFLAADSPKVSDAPVVLLYVHAQVMVEPFAMESGGLYFVGTGSLHWVPWSFRARDNDRRVAPCSAFLRPDAQGGRRRGAARDRVG